jgi:hypothetical protein
MVLPLCQSGLTCPGRFLRWSLTLKELNCLHCCDDAKATKKPPAKPQTTPSLATIQRPLTVPPSRTCKFSNGLGIFFRDFCLGFSSSLLSQSPETSLSVSFLSRDTLLFSFFFARSLITRLDLHRQAACFFPGTDLVHASSYPQTQSFFPTSHTSPR